MAAEAWQRLAGYPWLPQRSWHWMHDMSLLSSSRLLHPLRPPPPPADNIKYFYDIKDRGDFRANPDYKGVCHVALAQEGHCKPGAALAPLCVRH